MIKMLVMQRGLVMQRELAEQRRQCPKQALR
jgi:hypothetical protein